MSSVVTLVPSSVHWFLDKIFEQLQSHDPQTYTHCHRVGEMTLELSKAFCLSQEEQQLAYYSGLLHDIGKIKISEQILNKPGALTREEYEIVKKHTDWGVEMIQSLNDFPLFQQVSRAVLYHHERIDGHGYYQMKSDQIPKTSKFILVVDTVDAMTQDRAYRKGLPLQAAYDELLRCSGTQFDPQVVEMFLSSVLNISTKLDAA